MLRKIALLFGIILLLPTIALAAEIKTGEILTIDKQEKNIYAFASEVKTESDVNGDLVACGQTIDVDKKVENGLIAAGSSIRISGEVGNSARIFGAQVDISGKIKGDLIIFAGTARISDTATIEGDTIVLAGATTYNGKTNGRAKFNGNSVNINGQIGGDTEIRSDKILIGGKTVIGGKMKYRSQNDANIAPEAQIKGAVEKNESAKLKTGILALSAAAGWSDFLLAITGVFILAIAISHFRPKFIYDPVELANKIPATLLWKGIVGLIVVPVITIILMVTMVGALAGAVSMVVYVLSLLVSYALAVTITGSYVTRVITKDYAKQSIWLTVLIGAVVYTLINWIPYLGLLARFIVFVIAFGAIVENIVRIQAGNAAKK